MATPERSEFRAAFYVEKKPGDRKKLDAAKRAAELGSQKRGGAVNGILRVILFAVIVIGGIAVIISLRDISGFFGILWHE